MQTCVAPRSLTAPHSRQNRWLAKPNRDGFVLAGVVTGRGLSPSSVPAAVGPRAGVGTCRDEAPLSAAQPARHGGCRGFTGPFPPPLWMSVMKLSPAL